MYSRDTLATEDEDEGETRDSVLIEMFCSRTPDMWLSCNSICDAVRLSSYLWWLLVCGLCPASDLSVSEVQGLASTADIRWWITCSPGMLEAIITLVLRNTSTAAQHTKHSRVITSGIRCRWSVMQSQIQGYAAVITILMIFNIVSVEPSCSWSCLRLSLRRMKLMHLLLISLPDNWLSRNQTRIIVYHKSFILKGEVCYFCATTTTRTAK